MRYCENLDDIQAEAENHKTNLKSNEAVFKIEILMR